LKAGPFESRKKNTSERTIRPLGQVRLSDVYCTCQVRYSDPLCTCALWIKSQAHSTLYNLCASLSMLFYLNFRVKNILTAYNWHQITQNYFYLILTALTHLTLIALFYNLFFLNIIFVQYCKGKYYFFIP
jgi:hypothetical protein